MVDNSNSSNRSVVVVVVVELGTRLLEHAYGLDRADPTAVRASAPPISISPSDTLTQTQPVLPSPVPAQLPQMIGGASAPMPVPAPPPAPAPPTTESPKRPPQRAPAEPTGGTTAQPPERPTAEPSQATRTSPHPMPSTIDEYAAMFSHSMGGPLPRFMQRATPTGSRARTPSLRGASPQPSVHGIASDVESLHDVAFTLNTFIEHTNAKFGHIMSLFESTMSNLRTDYRATEEHVQQLSNAHGKHETDLK